MRKHIALFSLVILTGFFTSAQVAINASATSPDASAMLDVQSTNSGLLIPRMTTMQRTTNISSPAEGLMVYDTDTRTFWYYKTAIGWLELSRLTLPYADTATSSSNLFSVTNKGTGAAIFGMNATSSPSASGIIGIIRSSAAGNYSAAIRGVNESTTDDGIGVMGSQNGSGYGVYGTTVNGYGVLGVTDGGFAIYGSANTGTAGRFETASTSSSENGIEVVNNGAGNAASFYSNTGTGILVSAGINQLALKIESGGLKYPITNLASAQPIPIGTLIAVVQNNNVGGFQNSTTLPCSSQDGTIIIIASQDPDGIQVNTCAGVVAFNGGVAKQFVKIGSSWWVNN